VRSWDFSARLGVVARPCEASWEARRIPSGLCVAPLRLGGLRGKQSTPSDWLGGTGVVSTVGERERRGVENLLVTTTTLITSAFFFFMFIKVCAHV
jgi:hypothetical protein